MGRSRQAPYAPGVQRGSDALEHASGVEEDFIVREAKYEQSGSREQGIAAELASGLREVWRTIRFDHQARLLAEEVGDVWAQRLLPPKLRTFETPAP
jgi:hypothetical protein